MSPLIDAGSPSGSLGATPEIALDQLRVGDQIVIQTAHSAYIFLVIDPSRHLGLVVGGVFGNYAAEASLRVLPATRDHRLRPGVRVRFYIGSSAGYRRVTTSTVTDIIHRRTGIDPPR